MLLIKDATFKIKRGRKVGIIGDNGSWKSTLLREILKGEKSNIKIANKVTIGYFDQNQKTLIIVCHDRKFIGNICDYIIEIKDKCIKEFDCSYKHYINEKNKPRVSNEEKVDKEKLLLAQIKLSEVISLLSIEKDIAKKDKLEYEYNILLKEIKALKN